MSKLIFLKTTGVGNVSDNDSEISIVKHDDPIPR
jgi:hypothetical protein